MKYWLSIITTIFLLNCNIPNEINLSDTIMFEGEIYQLNESKPFTGIVYNNYITGEREYEGSYKNGRPHGKIIYWYKNGSKKKEGQLNYGVQIGKWCYYDSIGILRESITYSK